MIKQRFNVGVAIFSLISVSLFVYSCIKQELLSSSKIELNSNFKLSEAKSYFENNAKDLRLVDFNHSAENDMKTKSANIFDNVIPDWGKAVQFTNSNSIIFEVPFQQKAISSAFVTRVRDSLVLKKQVQAHTSLVVQKFPQADTIRYFVVTVIGEYYGEEDINKVQPFHYIGDRRHFRGYLLISNTQGKVLRSYYFDKGGRKLVVIKSDTQANTSSNHTLIRIAKTSVLTKGGGYETGEDIYPCEVPGCSGQVINGECNSCGTRYLGGVICEDEGVYCPECGNYKGQCICCPICHHYPCTCNDPVPCPYCGDPYCNGSCQTLIFCPTCGAPLVDGICSNCSNKVDPPQEGEEEILKCTLIIDIAEGEGDVTGSGSDYNLFQQVSVSATPKKGFKFACWGGDFSSYTTASFSHKLTANTTHGSVYFTKLLPCSDLLKSNPLLNMKIKAGISGLISSGDWEGRNKTHKGIDLGDEGDPIYAMFDGKVTKAVDVYDDDLLWDNYTSQTKSDKCGNRVEYSCTVNGNNIIIQCWHMKKDIKGLKMGDIIKKGQIIGNVGQSGNASHKRSAGPHLHLQIKKNGTIVSPHDYIYSTYLIVDKKYINNGSPDNDCNK